MNNAGTLGTLIIGNSIEINGEIISTTTDISSITTTG